jgi:hypothetical protein
VTMKSDLEKLGDVIYRLTNQKVELETENSALTQVVDLLQARYAELKHAAVEVIRLYGLTSMPDYETDLAIAELQACVDTALPTIAKEK